MRGAFGPCDSSSSPESEATSDLLQVLQPEVPGSTWDTVVADATAESTPATPPGSANPASGGTPIGFPSRHAWHCGNSGRGR